MVQRLLTPGEIVQSSNDIVRVILPERATLFADRARRLRQLAHGHSMHDYLTMIAALIDEQGKLLNAYPSDSIVLPDARAIALAREHAMPPLAVQSWQRDPSWRSVARSIAAAMRPRVEGTARTLIARVSEAQDVWLDQQANIIVNGLSLGLDRGVAVFVAAALQVYWTHTVLALPADAIGPLDHPGSCPCCGSRPVASIIRAGAQSGLRYLACSLCATQWHFVRIACANCASNNAMQYFNVDGEKTAVRAEACDDCDTYLKVVNCEVDPLVEPVADDLATITLDLLMAETTHFLRSGVNLALFHGDSGE